MNQAPLLAILLCAVIFSSCTRKIYQVSEFAYTGEHGTEAPNITDHEDITITYELEDKDGLMAFTVYNRMDQSLIIDFSRSSLIVGKTNLPYYENIATTSMRSVTGDFSIVELSRGEALSKFDQAQVSIAPQSEMTFQKFRIDPSLVQDMRVKDTESRSLEEFPPFTFRHYLCYRIDQDGAPRVFIEDSFEVTTTSLMGDIAFEKSLDAQTAMQTYSPIKIREKISVLGLIVFGGCIGVILWAAS